MKALILKKTGKLEVNKNPLEAAELPTPKPGHKQVRLKVSVCGVCHTELDEIEGRVTPKLPVVPGHQVVGVVDELGDAVSKLSLGDRVGVGWIFKSVGGSKENVDPSFCATGKDVDGGYAQFMTVHEDYAYPIPEFFSDEQAAPLLCAGAIGYRSLKLCNLVDGERLGLTGFGGSGHIVLQLARHLYPKSEVYVFARDPDAQEFALSLGADWAGDTEDAPPHQLAAIIDTTPVWKPVVYGLKHLAPGGRLVINAIRKESVDQQELLALNYTEHLWQEKEIKSVANICSEDIREFLLIAADIPIVPKIQVYALSQANQALRDLKYETVTGSKVLKIP